MIRKIYEWFLHPIARAVYKRYPGLYWWRRGQSYYNNRVLLPWERRAREDIARKVLSWHPSRVLEYGVGNGQLLKRVSEGDPALECHGVDISATQMKKASLLAPNARLSVSNITKLEYPDDYFDVVYGISVLMYIPQEKREQAFKELYRVCRGYLVAYELVPKYYDDAARKRYCEATDFRYDYDYEESLKQAGFEIVEVIKDPHSWSDYVIKEGALPFGLIIARKHKDKGSNGGGISAVVVERLSDRNDLLCL